MIVIVFYIIQGVYQVNKNKQCDESPPHMQKCTIIHTILLHRETDTWPPMGVTVQRGVTKNVRSREVDDSKKNKPLGRAVFALLSARLC